MSATITVEDNLPLPHFDTRKGGEWRLNVDTQLQWAGVSLLPPTIGLTTVGLRAFLISRRRQGHLEAV